MIGHAMDASRSRRRTLAAVSAIAAAASLVWTTAGAAEQTAPTPQRPKGVVIRGCLTGSKLTHLDFENVTVQLPDTLRVRNSRVIRDQVKALNGHTVEVVGTLRGI